MPLENEWYKAAYYSPNYGRTGVGGYYIYATQSNSAPGTTIGGRANQANYNGAIGHATDVGSFRGSRSFYGTFDQSGNVAQWNEYSDTSGSFRGLRGGVWDDGYSGSVSSSGHYGNAPSVEYSSNGFRLASLAAALTPTFGSTTSTVNGFTVQISNYDSSYSWAGTATASGSVVVSGTGLVTVTGVAALTSSTATITTTKSNTVGGSAPVTATSLAAALTPAFGSTTATADGFTVVITDYNAAYTWAGTATASGTVVVTGSGSTGLVTVTGVAIGTSSTATITTTRTGYTGGTNTVTATSVVGAALTPAFGSTTATTTGFTVQVTNYDSSYTWAGTATASGSVSINGTGLVTVTGVAAGTSSTATITTTKSNTVGGSATVTATSLFFAMSMVTVGNAGNAADTTGYGAVSYAYQIGKYDVTGSQYTAFLNAVGSTDTYALYNTSMGTDPNSLGYAQISQSGSSGSYTYAVMNSTGNRPVSFVTWFDCARFSNWMSNGHPSGAQSSTTTEDGAYNVNGATSGNAVAANATNPNTGSAPTFRMPLENEWYKAAYYSPNYGRTGVGGYYVYATQSNVAPGTTIGSSPNQANYNGDIGHSTDVGSFSGSGSFYGTFDQSGNVFQWNDLDGTAGSSRGLRGGYWYNISYFVSSSYRYNDDPSYGSNFIGFRLASPV